MVKVIEDKFEKLLFDMPHATFVLVEVAHAMVKRGEAFPTGARSSGPFRQAVFNAGNAGLHLSLHRDAWGSGYAETGKGQNGQKNCGEFQASRW